jgi:hypothetical protein
VLRWDYVRLNLPGSQDYQAHLPWISLVRKDDGCLACNFDTYVDDTRTCGNWREEARLVSRAVASKMNWLGIQDAARKRRDPCQNPGPWAGSVVHVCAEGEITVLVTQERWNKTRSIIEWIRKGMDEGEDLEFKTIEKHRGFLVYVSRTYPSMVPYLRGVHLTLDSWRPWRKEDGWKMTQSEIALAMRDEEYETIGHDLVNIRKAAARVRWVPRLRGDIEALTVLTASDSPPHRSVRPKAGSPVVYSFGDASGSGFGSSFERENQLSYYSGQWSDEIRAKSSNFRELNNLTNALEQAHSDGTLADSEVFVFTDNSTAETAYFKGTSSSQELFQITLRLQNVQMVGRTSIHFVHIAGKRMILQGTDGLSRGINTVGAMGGESLVSFVPLHLSASTRAGTVLKEWVSSMYGEGITPRWLSPEDWYGLGHTIDFGIWDPPPAAADAALEQLAKAVHKRPQLTRLVLIPRLVTVRWRRLLHKICNLVFTVPVDSDIWTSPKCEPLIVGISLPLSRHPPWKIRGSSFVVGVERELYGLSAVGF